MVAVKYFWIFFVSHFWNSDEAELLRIEFMMKTKRVHCIAQSAQNVERVLNSQTGGHDMIHAYFVLVSVATRRKRFKFQLICNSLKYLR